MHPRNLYLTPPDFVQLAEDVPSLKPFLLPTTKSKATIDFKDPEALRTLTRSLLLRDFKCDVVLPEDRLCPIIAGRLDYVLILQDIVTSDRGVLHAGGDADPTSTARGLDIGTGASVIYPMLYTAIDESVELFGTDINEVSLESGRLNVERNKLQERVHLLHVDSTEGFFEQTLQHTERLDFTMCNPPFYDSQEDMDLSTAQKALPPHAVCTGAPNEMITKGGEVEFVARMIRESTSYFDKIRRFSSLVGKATSVIALVKQLLDMGCTNYGLIESAPGQTQRWVLVWSGSDIRLPDRLARQLSEGSPLSKSLPLPNTLSYTCPQRLAFDEAAETVSRFITELGLNATRLGQTSKKRQWLISATHLSWTRAARRAHKGTDQVMKEHYMDCRLTILESAVDSEISLICEWIRGHHRQAFESFFSTGVRKLAAVAKTRKSSLGATEA